MVFKWDRQRKAECKERRELSIYSSSPLIKCPKFKRLWPTKMLFRENVWTQLHSTSIFRLCFIVVSKLIFERLFFFELLIIFIEYAFECHDKRMFHVYIIISCTDWSSTQHTTTVRCCYTCKQINVEADFGGSLWKKTVWKYHTIWSTRPKECLQINMVVTVGQLLRQPAGADVALYHRIRYSIPQYTIY